MEFIRSMFYFILVGIFEIGGGYLIWLWLRGGKSALYGVIGGGIALIGVLIIMYAPRG